MALVAATRAVEVGLALFRVASDDVLERICRAVTGGIGLDVQPRDEVRDLRLCQVRLRHSLVGTAVAQDRRYEDALFIGQNDNRADEVGRRRIPARGVAVTAGAMGGVELRAPLDGLRVLVSAGDRGAFAAGATPTRVDPRFLSDSAE